MEGSPAVVRVLVTGSGTAGQFALHWPVHVVWPNFPA